MRQPERTDESGARFTRERRQQGRERNPGECGVTELRKTQREKETGDSGAEVIEGARRQGAIYRVTQGLNCSSFWSFAAIVSASRLVGNFPMRTRYIDGVPAAGASTYAE